MGKEKYLIVCSRNVDFGSDSGADSRLLEQVISLQKRFHVTILHASPLQGLEAHASGIHEVVFSRQRLDLTERLKALFTVQPLFLGKRSWSTLLSSLLPDYDYFQSDLFLTSYYFPKHIRSRCIAYVQDSPSRYQKSKSDFLIRNREYGRFLLSFMLLTRARLWERRIKGFISAVYVNGADTAYSVNNHTSIGMLKAVKSNDKQHAAHFKKDWVTFGNYYYEPNKVGVEFFLKTLVRNPCFHNYHGIVFGRCSNKLYPTPQNVLFRGRVDKFEETLLSAKIVFLPIFFGSGFKNKLLECASLSCCIVTTKHVVEGSLFKPGVDVVIRDTPREMLLVLKELSAEEANWIGNNAKEVFDQNYSQKQTQVHLDKCTHEI